jgi:hypothetical protein
MPTHTATTAPTAAPSPTPTTNLGISPVAAKAADSIVDTVGVVTHFSYTNTVYGYLTPSNPAPNGDSVLSSLQTLGVRHLRDGDALMSTTPAICSAFQAAYAAGTDADIVIFPTDTVATLQTITSCVGAGLRAIEGPNELDNTGDTNYATDDVSSMSLIAGARGSAFATSVSLFAPSMANTCTAYAAEAAVNNDVIAGLFDDNNAHIYYSGNQPETAGYGSVSCAAGPFGAESTDIAEAKIPAPAKPIVVTETGYPDASSDAGYVPPTVKTKYTLRALLTHYLAGARYAYFYELAAENGSYGLTDSLLNPKPAYTALENFIRILGDRGGSGVSGSLRYSLNAGSAHIGQLLLEKQDGSFWLVLWQTNPSWNPISNVAITVPPATGTISFGLTPSALRLYTFNPATGAATATALTPSNPASLTITDTPEILQIGTTSSPPVLATPQPPVN